MTVLSAILYTITDLMLFVIIWTYTLAFVAKPKIHVLALLLFFISVFFLTMVATIDLWSLCATGDVFRFPFSYLRGLFLSLSSSFLFYTTVKK